MGRLYDIIQAHIDAQQHGTSVRKVALAIGVSPTTVSNWRNITELPSRENLEAIARVTGVRYEEVFYAAGVDAGYIVENEVEPDWRDAANGDEGALPTAARKGAPRLPE